MSFSAIDSNYLVTLSLTRSMLFINCSSISLMICLDWFMSYAIYTTNWSKAFFVAFSGIYFSLLFISSKFNSFIRLFSSLILLSLLSIRCCTCSIFYLSSFDIPPAATGFLYIGLTPYLFYYILPSTSSYIITCYRIFNSFIKSS